MWRLARYELGTYDKWLDDGHWFSTWCPFYTVTQHKNITRSMYRSWPHLAFSRFPKKQEKWTFDENWIPSKRTLIVISVLVSSRLPRVHVLWLYATIFDRSPAYFRANFWTENKCHSSEMHWRSRWFQLPTDLNRIMFVSTVMFEHELLPTFNMPCVALQQCEQFCKRWPLVRTTSHWSRHDNSLLSEH